MFDDDQIRKSLALSLCEGHAICLKGESPKYSQSEFVVAIAHRNIIYKCEMKGNISIAIGSLDV